ncbi:hypothetical protein GCM10007874_40180 [Labrys miyagiensis]|uniref:Uncharacterized protein n=1 Tax=Labrys miyagiensis TaxID=346912 RepID=A0ABQ6CL34_9HYPH|nr:hypothetical protein GCM10007874_40180 [Labrys miyagiensis]
MSRVRYCLWRLEGEAEGGRHHRGPVRERRILMDSIEGGINLNSLEYGGVTFERRANRTE